MTHDSVSVVEDHEMRWTGKSDEDDDDTGNDVVLKKSLNDVVLKESLGDVVLKESLGDVVLEESLGIVIESTLQDPPLRDPCFLEKMALED